MVLVLEDGYFAGLSQEMAAQRGRLVPGLQARGYKVSAGRPGTYFCVIDLGDDPRDDATFCRDLVTDHGVAAIPLSAFYTERAWTRGVQVLFCQI